MVYVTTVLSFRRSKCTVADSSGVLSSAETTVPEISKVLDWENETVKHNKATKNKKYFMVFLIDSLKKNSSGVQQ